MTEDRLKEIIANEDYTTDFKWVNIIFAKLNILNLESEF